MTGGPGGGVGGGRSAEIGWLPDPTGRFPQRYRMRTGWTRRVRVGSAEAVDEVPVQGAQPAGAAAGGGDGPREPEPPGRRWVAASRDGGEWRRDPTGRFEQRWFDGRRLTRRVRHGGAVATDTVSPPRRRPSRVRRRAAAPADRDGPGWRPDPDGDGERFHDGHDWTAKWRPAAGGRRGRPPGSPWAWLPRSVVAGLGLLVAVVLVVVVVVLVA